MALRNIANPPSDDIEHVQSFPVAPASRRRFFSDRSGKSPARRRRYQSFPNAVALAILCKLLNTRTIHGFVRRFQGNAKASVEKFRPTRGHHHSMRGEAGKARRRSSRPARAGRRLRNRRCFGYRRAHRRKSYRTRPDAGTPGASLGRTRCASREFEVDWHDFSEIVEKLPFADAALPDVVLSEFGHASSRPGRKSRSAKCCEY